MPVPSRSEEHPTNTDLPVLNTITKPPASKGPGCMYCPYYPYTDNAHIVGLAEWNGGRVRETNHTCFWHVQGRGNRENPFVLFVGEAPGYDEDRGGEAFVGRSGELLDNLMAATNLDWSDCYATNTVRCRPEDNKTPTLKQSVFCSSYLARDIQALDPDVIVPLGALATKVVSGDKNAKITAMAGNSFVREIMGRNRTVVPMYHPAYVLRNDYVFDEYYAQFVSLGQLVYDLKNGHASSDRKVVPHRVLTHAADAWLILDTMIRQKRPVAFDIETRGGRNPFRDDWSAIPLVSLANSSDIGYCIPLMHTDVEWKGWERRAVMRKLKTLLTHPDIPKFGQNFKFDRLWCRQHWGIDIAPFMHDTMLTHYCAIRETRGLHGLDALSYQFTQDGGYKTAVEASEKEYDYNFAVMPLYGKEGGGVYSAKDAVVTYRVHEAELALIDKLEQEGKLHPLQRWLAFQYLPRLSDALTEMEFCGSRIDSHATRMLIRSFARRRRHVLKKLRQNPDVRRFVRAQREEGKHGKRKSDLFEFNPQSTPQLRALFFDFLGYTPLKDTDDKPWGDDRAAARAERKGKVRQPSTDKETLIWLQHKKKVKIAADIMEYRLVNQVLNTWLYGTYRRAIQSNGYIHGSWNLHSVVTGRLSSSDPNLMNIPNQAGGDVKRMYVSRFGDQGFILAVDYKQIEYRLLAVFAKVTQALRDFKAGGDPHRAMALRILARRYGGVGSRSPKEIEEDFGPKYDELPKDEKKQLRTIAKRVNFGVIYGAAGPTLRAQLASDKTNPIYITDEEANEYVAAFHEINPEVQPWQVRVMQEIYRTGKIHSVFGRQRHLHEANSADDEQRSRAERQGPNHVIQSSAAEITLTSLLILTEIFRERKFRSKIILTVHDSILFDVYAPEFKKVIRVVRDVMENVPEYSKRYNVWPESYDWSWWYECPIEIDAEVGPNWRDMVEIDGTLDESGKPLVVRNLRQLRSFLSKSRQMRDERDAATEASVSAHERDMSLNGYSPLTKNLVVV